MRHYKWDYESKYIGSSDIGSLIMAGCDENGLKVEALHFGGDSSYSAYIVDENAGIPERYKLQAAFEKWLKIYDDNELTFEATADRINVFRCGDYGCIIQLLFL